MEFPNIKDQILAVCEKKVSQKIDIVMTAIKNTEIASKEDTKSSAGDKYETNRAMMALEKQKLEMQLLEHKRQKKVLFQISAKTISTNIGFGSLVYTNQGNYFIAASLGSIEIDQNIIFCISLNSPLAQAFQGRKENDLIEFQGRSYQVVCIY